MILACLLPGVMLLGALAGCSETGAGPKERSLVVFAAASLSDAFVEISGAFEKDNPGVKISLNFAGSQRLRTQLEHGNRADVFASADYVQMDWLLASELLQGQPVPFATNRMAVIVPKSTSSAASIDGVVPSTGPVMSLADLAQEGVKLVLALPEVPAGAYARSVIETLGADLASGPKYSQRVLANVVSMEPNVRSVAQKVALGEADSGIVYWSDAQVEQLAGRVMILPIPEGSNVVATYPAARLRNSAEPELAAAFIEFLRSSQGQNILLERGFGAADAGQSSSEGGRSNNG
ncbi:MAG: molybdate ABC transporter substrate-binding protein [SAR202 cluster bacterium Io17-Chloro-G9]|nr:MAG: molybdate ABC transporter substrate-binding protein [SAR202 cluster bacterium Io17-Chloro-G9]